MIVSRYQNAILEAIVYRSSCPPKSVIRVGTLIDIGFVKDRYPEVAQNLGLYKFE